MTDDLLDDVPAVVAAHLRRVKAQLDAGRRLAAEVGRSHQAGRTRSCRLCTALVAVEASGLWTPDKSAKAAGSDSAGRRAPAGSADTPGSAAEPLGGLRPCGGDGTHAWLESELRQTTPTNPAYDWSCPACGGRWIRRVAR